MWKANSPCLLEKDSAAYLLQYSCPFEASMQQLPWPPSFTGRISTNLIDQSQLLLQEERKRGGGRWEWKRKRDIQRKYEGRKRKRKGYR